MENIGEILVGGSNDINFFSKNRNMSFTLTLEGITRDFLI